MINGHGNNLYSYKEGVIKVDFSSNIAFNNKSDLIIEQLKGNLNSIKNYPDPCTVNLSVKIAEHHKLQQENVLVANGSAEAFYLVAHFLANNAAYSTPSTPCNTLIHTPAFAEYEDSCALYNHNLAFAPISTFAQGDFSNFRSVWLGLPNNPDGFITNFETVIEKCNKFASTFFVVDMAYNELCSSMQGERGELPKNLILINSLTKSFGVPGIRLGYILACKEVIEQLSNMRPPWSVNSLSISVGEYIMDNYNSLIFNKDELIGESIFLQKELGEINSIEVIPSGCNFILCRVCNGKSAAELKEFLVENFGILIRDASNFRGLSREYFRVAAQCRESNLQLIAALKEF